MLKILTELLRLLFPIKAMLHLPKVRGWRAAADLHRHLLQSFLHHNKANAGLLVRNGNIKINDDTFFLGNRAALRVFTALPVNLDASTSQELVHMFLCVWLISQINVPTGNANANREKPSGEAPRGWGITTKLRSPKAPHKWQIPIGRHWNLLHLNTHIDLNAASENRGRHMFSSSSSIL